MMAMWKMTGWLAKTVAAGLIISFLSIWTTGYIVNSYLQTLLKQYNLPLEVQPMALSGMWGKLWGADPIQSTASKAPQEDTEEPVAVDAFSDQTQAPLTDIGIGSGTKANGEKTEETGESTEPVEEGTGQAPAIEGTETAITTDDLSEIKSQMSEADKEQLFGMLMGKLPQEAWQTISGYMENGLTDEELTLVEQLMAQHLDKEQYEQMLGILKKY